MAIVVPTYVRTSGGSGGSGRRTEGDGGSKISRRREMAEDGGRSAGDGEIGERCDWRSRSRLLRVGRPPRAGGRVRLVMIPFLLERKKPWRQIC